MQKALEAGPALPALSLATPGTEDASELAALWVAALLLAVCNGWGVILWMIFISSTTPSRRHTGATRGRFLGAMGAPSRAPLPDAVHSNAVFRGRMTNLTD